MAGFSLSQFVLTMLFNCRRVYTFLPTEKRLLFFPSNRSRKVGLYLILGVGEIRDVGGRGGGSIFVVVGGLELFANNNNNNVYLSCVHQRPERSHDTY